MRIATINVWVEAFYVFVGVYTSRFAHEPPGLMKYAFTILATRGHKWRFYDENVTFYRKLLLFPLPGARSICNFGSALRVTPNPVTSNKHY